MQIDLSHRIETGMTIYPGDPSVAVDPHATHPSNDCHVDSVELGSHTGTHVDAPLHIAPDGRALDTYSLDDFTFEAVRVDCTALDDRDPISVEFVPDCEAEFVVFWTGWSAHWNTERYLDHPYLTPDAATACAERGYAVGVDTLNPDPTPTENAVESEPDGFRAHRTLLGADELIVENLRNLGAVSERFELRAYPLALGGDGAPVRAVGVVE